MLLLLKILELLHNTPEGKLLCDSFQSLGGEPLLSCQMTAVVGVTMVTTALTCQLGTCQEPVGAC